MKGKGTVRVYIEMLNNWDSVIDSKLIAEFYNMNWAKEFIIKTKMEVAEGNTSRNVRRRVRVEED